MRADARTPLSSTPVSCSGGAKKLFCTRGNLATWGNTPEAYSYKSSSGIRETDFHYRDTPTSTGLSDISEVFDRRLSNCTTGQTEDCESDVVSAGVAKPLVTRRTRRVASNWYKYR